MICTECHQNQTEAAEISCSQPDDSWPGFEALPIAKQGHFCDRCFSVLAKQYVIFERVVK